MAVAEIHKEKEEVRRKNGRTASKRVLRLRTKVVAKHTLGGACRSRCDQLGRPVRHLEFYVTPCHESDIGNKASCKSKLFVMKVTLLSSYTAAVTGSDKLLYRNSQIASQKAKHTRFPTEHLQYHLLTPSYRDQAFPNWMHQEPAIHDTDVLTGGIRAHL